MSHTIRNATPEELLTRLRKVEGQIRGLQHMIEPQDMIEPERRPRRLDSGHGRSLP